MHPNERDLRREYDARAQRDVASLAALLTEAAVWHVPGRSAISGEYRGITINDVLANDEHGLVIASGRAKRRGKAVEWRTHGIYRFEDGKIAECWLLPKDQAVFDEIWA
jgi:ketosteroid isomerase-like protein